MNSLTSSSSSTPAPTIDTRPLVVTALPQFFGAFTALGAAAIAIYQVIAGVNTTDPLKIALIGLVGVGILAWAIAATGDTIARAYASAHVTRTEPGKENQPALQAAAIRFADAYAAAHGVKPPTPAIPTDGGAPAATNSVYSPSAPAASKECCLGISPPLQVKVRGKDAQAVAVLTSGESGKETQRYLVGLPDSQLTWVSNDAISLPAAALAPVATAVPSGPPAQSGPPASSGPPPPGNGSATS